MDPLSDFTALSPHANEPSLAARRAESQEISSQQCSADPNAFAGLGRAHSVVVTTNRSGESYARTSGGALRLALEVGGGGASQMSQPGSQFHDALLEDTQHDEDEELAQDRAPPRQQALQLKKPEAEVMTVQPVARLRDVSDDARGGFLSTLERRLPKTAATRAEESDQQTVEILSSDEEEDAMEVEMPVNETGAGSEAGRDVTRTSAHADTEDETHRDAVENRVVLNGEESDHEHDNGDEFDYRYRRDSMDSLPETQPLDEYEEEIEANSSREDTFPSTEVVDTLDEDDAPVAAPVTALSASPELARVNAATAAPTVSKATTPIEEKANSETKMERTPQFLKRKQKAKQTLHHDSDAFVNTEDQTLMELAARIRREREAKFQEVKSLAAPPQPVTSTIENSQEELTPTQPSKSSPETVVHVALKKRGKACHVSAQELSASQERSYEFVDSSCRCGEAVCVCAVDIPAVKSTARPSSAIRNLEFSFATPESQESESQLMDSLPDVGALALKTLQAAQIVEQQQQAKKPMVSKWTPPRRAEDQNEPDSVDSTPKKARTIRDSPIASVTDTPPTSRKRGRAFLSPDAGAEPHSRDTTPRKSSRSSKPPIAPSPVPGTSTPSVRTRTKILSPVPTAASRSYSSRSKSVFKNARQFCLTGFTGDGLDNLQKLIEDYGGKVCPEDVLIRKNNSKVVVIATPISWRKLKFMCAVACGIPVVHPEWIHGCIKARSVIPFDGYFVPSGCSVVTGKFECLPVKELDIFKGLRFGIPYDVSPLQVDSTKGLSSLIAFILRECGAESVQEDLKPSRESAVDIVLADEYTKACEYYENKHRSSVKTLSWVTECVILQRFIGPDEAAFSPRLPSSSDSAQNGGTFVSSAIVPVGEDVQLKLHIGELLLVDLSAEGDIDHFLLFDVCEILSIRVIGSRVGGKRKHSGSGGSSVKLQVGVLERRPNSPALRRNHTRIIDLSPEKVKRRVVAVSKEDFDRMSYRDETIFFYEEE